MRFLSLFYQINATKISQECYVNVSKFTKTRQTNKDIRQEKTTSKQTYIHKDKQKANRNIRRRKCIHKHLETDAHATRAHPQTQVNINANAAANTHKQTQAHTNADMQANA